MNKESKFGRWWLLGLAIAFLGFMAIFLSKPSTPTTRRITITMDSNGTPRLAGIPLLTTNLRDGTFNTMGALGVKAGLAVTTPTNSTQESNLLETLKSMSRAGLFSTNRPPNPYE